jgi:hypothetical protein
MSTSHDNLLVELEHCETQVWDALVKGDQVADANALHDSFLGVYSDGFAEKTDHVRQLEDGPTIEQFILSKCKVLPLGDNYAVFSYRADFLRTKKHISEAMYVSSVWKRNEDSWINMFSQDTPASS